MNKQQQIDTMKDMATQKSLPEYIRNSLLLQVALLEQNVAEEAVEQKRSTLTLKKSKEQ